MIVEIIDSNTFDKYISLIYNLNLQILTHQCGCKLYIKKINVTFTSQNNSDKFTLHIGR